MSEMRCPVCGLYMIANTTGWYCPNGHAGESKKTFNNDPDEWRPCEDCATKDGHIKKLEGETARLMRLTDALTRYVVLLTGEIDSLAPEASLHGWKSTRAAAGVKLRAEIEAAKKVGT